MKKRSYKSKKLFYFAQWYCAHTLGKGGRFRQRLKTWEMIVLTLHMKCGWAEIMSAEELWQNERVYHGSQRR